MSKSKKTVLVIFLLFMASGVWVLFSDELVNKAPDIAFNTINGETILLKSLQGKPTLVTFWATDCPGCIKEIPHLKALHRDYHDKGVNIIAVAMYYDRPDNVIAMAKAKQMNYKVALDPVADASKAFGNVRLTPTSFLIAPDGSIAMQKLGEFNEATMRQRLDSFLKIS